jgi:NADPH2:quinone reductase
MAFDSVTCDDSDSEAIRKLFSEIAMGYERMKVKVEIRHTYPLAESVQVHRDLEGRRTVGSIVMVP